MAEFKVAFKSTNLNSFGLRQMILISREGIGYRVCANSINEKDKGTVLNVPMNGKTADFSQFGFELVEKIRLDAPKDIMEVIWK